MTRFARSAGATGQSKTIHDSTPWALLKPKQHREKNNLKVHDKKINKTKKRSPPDLSKPLTLPPLKPPKGNTKEGIAAMIESISVTNVSSNDSKNFKAKKHMGSMKVRKTVNQIKNDYKKEGKAISQQEETEIELIVKKSEKSEQRRIKRAVERDSKKVCFKCRESGHDMSSCPLFTKDRESGTGICFKCGSTEHTLNKCRVKLPAGEFPFAKCFICGENGHLSKQCPDNPKGLYPNGGCCNCCGSVEHYKSSCPEMLKQQGLHDFRLHQWTSSSCSADDDLMIQTEEPKAAKKTKLKVVKF